jgi:GT2 family glycosyltransferase
MRRHLTRALRRLADRIRRCWHRPDGTIAPGMTARGLAWAWQRARALAHRLRRQPAFLLVLDTPPRLCGFAALTGWAVSRSGPVRWVEAIVNGQVIAAGGPSEARPDVAGRFPRFRFHGPAGFRLAPPAGLLADGRYPLCVRARDAAGRVAELHATLEVEDYRLADTPDLPGHLRGSNREYQAWLRHADRAAASDPPDDGPLISVIMPVFRPDPQHLRDAVRSVRAQRYGRWELCVCDDGSGQSELTCWLEELSAAEPRVRWTALAANRGIAAATNTALRLARGEYVAFLDQDDLLAPDALAEVARALAREPADLLYTDEDRLDEHGYRVEPLFKPDWSPDLLLSRMYLGHLCVYRRAFLERIGPCRPEFDGTQDYELALRAAAQAARIAHVPRVLYHWRLGGHSANPAVNRICHARGRRAIEEALQRQGAAGEVTDGPHGCAYHVRYRHERWPLVSILIPTRDNLPLVRRCLSSIRRRTDYPCYEVLLIDNGSRDPRTRAYLRAARARVLRLDLPFNHSRLNNLAVPHARGELLLLLNDDTEVITPDWLTALAEQALRPEVGAAGAWLFHPDGRTQHAGIIVGLGPVATPLHSGITRDGLDRGTVRLIRTVSAITGACLMIRREVYREIGGLDEDELPTSFNDVDLCLRLRKAGYRIVCTPLAQLYHHESASRTISDEQRFVRIMHERWGDELARDPYWNPNLPHGPDPHPGFAFHWRAARADQLPVARGSARAG